MTGNSKRPYSRDVGAFQHHGTLELPLQAAALQQQWMSNVPAAWYAAASSVEVYLIPVTHTAEKKRLLYSNSIYKQLLGVLQLRLEQR
jgi:hypothetical protein